MPKGSFDTMVERSVRNEIGKLQEKGVIPIPEGDSDLVVEEGRLPSSDTKRMLSDILTSEGCFAKVYKINSSTGKKEPKGYDIEFPIEGSLEAELNRVAKERGWGSGGYVVMGFEHGQRGIIFNKKIVVPEPTPTEKEMETASKPPKSTPTEPFEIVDKAFQIADRIKPKEVDVASIANTVVEAIKTGKEMSGGNGVDVLLSKFLPLLIPLFEKNLKPDFGLTEDKIVRIIQTEIEKLKPKEDFLEQMVKLREFEKTMGKKDDALDSVHKVTQIVEAIRPLAGGPGGELEPPSWGRLLMEALPKFIEPIVSTFKDFAETKKMELSLIMQQRRIGSGNLVPLVDQSGLDQIPEKVPHPFVTTFLRAVNEDNESYFDHLRQRIATISPQFIDGLITGEFTINYILTIASEVYGLPVDNPKLKPYMEKFVEWLKKEFGEIEKDGDIPAS